MMLSSVDLPQPLGPTRQRKPPTLTCSETASSACTSPPRPVKNRFETRSTARAVARTPPVWYVAIRGWRFVSRPARKEIGADVLAHLSHLLPLGREHINLTWDYIWHSNKRVTQGRFRPLRAPHKIGVSVDAVRTLLFAVAAGGGTLAQFNHPELGGNGQWMSGGMTMVGDMFNYGLKATVSGCARSFRRC